MYQEHSCSILCYPEELLLPELLDELLPELPEEELDELPEPGGLLEGAMGMKDSDCPSWTLCTGYSLPHGPGGSPVNHHSAVKARGYCRIGGSSINVVNLVLSEIHAYAGSAKTAET